MANQMIALGARGAPMPDLGRAAQQYGAMLGVAAQQRASQRQAEQATQAMDIARNQEQRAIAQHEIEQAGRQIDFYTRLAGQTMNRAGYEQLLGRLDRDAPEIAAQFRTNLPPESFDRGSLLQMVGSIADNFRTNFGPLETEVVQLADGTFGVAQTGGNRTSGVFRLEEFEPVPQGSAPPATGAPAAPAAGAPATGGGVLTPDEAAPILRGATESGAISPADADRIRRSLGPNGQSQFEQWMRDNNVRLTPASFGGEMGGVQPLTMETAPQIIQNAVQSRMIDQSHLQQLREMVGPDNERSLASWMQSNQIRIQPTGGMAQPSLRSAEYRPGMDAAPQFQQVQAVTGPGGATFRPTGRAAQGRPPLTSPSQEPSSAGAVAEAQREPIPSAATRAGATTRAEREAEAATIYERTRRERQAQTDATFAETYPSSSTTVRDGLRVFDRLIGDARVSNGRVVVPRGGRRPHPGFEGLVGLGIPGMRFIPASREADADALFRQIQGKAFLEAFETLKGGGQITEREGQVATEAMSRLGRNISEAEFIEAANELRNIMRNSLARADRRAERLGIPITTGSAPAASRRTPTRAAPTRTRRGAAVSNW